MLTGPLPKFHGIRDILVKHGDARSTGFPDDTFDFVTARLVLVNVPHPEQIAAEAVRVVRPGGSVAFHEVDWAGILVDPPSEAIEDLISLFVQVSGDNGSDCYVGRRTPRMLAEAGLVDIGVKPLMHHHPIGDPRRSLLVDFADNFGERIIETGLASQLAFDQLRSEASAFIDDPASSVFIGPFVQAWGRKPLA